MSTEETFTVKVTTTISTGIPDTEEEPNTTEVVAAIVGVLLIIISFIVVLYYFTRYKHNRFACCRKLRQRTWSSNSYSQHNPLEPDETGTSDPTPRTDRRFFSITENDDDGFIYDEIFDASEFVDKETKKSIRNLYSPTKTTDDLPDLNLRI